MVVSGVNRVPPRTSWTDRTRCHHVTGGDTSVVSMVLVTITQQNIMSEIAKITTIINAIALPIEEKDGVFVASVEFTTANGKFAITVDQIDDIYRGLVKSWPIIKPLKDELNVRRREANIAKARADREAREAELVAKRAKAKADREALLASREAEKAEKDRQAREKLEKIEKAKEKAKTPKPGKVIAKDPKPGKRKKA